MNTKLVIVQGIPASGKTTLSNRLAAELPEFALLQKDTIKEMLFDTVGIKNEEWSKLLGKVSTEAMYSMAKTFLSNGIHVMLESAFYKQFAVPDIVAFGVPVLEIYCECDEKIRIERYEKRQTTIRHPGHHQVNGVFDPRVYAPLKLVKYFGSIRQMG